MAKKLTQLRVAEISAVDRGAGEGVRIALMKRLAEGGKMSKVDKTAAIEAYLGRNIFTEAEAQAKIDKREFSGKDRKRLAGSGAALPDGSFPIANEQDLKNAIRAVGRASDPGKARAHIMSRARSMGLTSLIPDKWKKGVKKRLRKSMQRFVVSLGIEKALDFNTAQANAEAKEYADGVMCEVREACSSLQQACWSISCDDSVTDKKAAFEVTFAQFHDHLAGIVPEGVEQALQAAQLIAEGARVNPQGAVVTGKAGKGTAMAMDEKEQAAFNEQKQRRKDEKTRRKAAEAQVGELKKQNTLLQKRLDGVLALTPTQKAWFDHPDNEMSTEQQVAFFEMKTEKRDELVAATSVEQLTEKRLAGLPESVRKELEESRQFRKTAADGAEAARVVQLTKRATDLGLPEALGPHLAAIAKAQPEAYAEVDKTLAALTAQVKTSKLFGEFGGAGNGDNNTAIAKMNARVEELMKNDPKIRSRESAISKISESRLKGDQDIWREYKAEGQGLDAI